MLHPTNTATIAEPSPALPQNENGSPRDTRGPADQPATAQPSGGFWSRAIHAVPNVLVLAGLAALGYWGHHTGWTMPRLSALTGNGQAQRDDWCAAHAVLETVCVECKPDLMPKGKQFGWCKVHGVSECPWEHPEVAQLKATPTVSPDALARAQRALDFAPRPENSSKCKLHERRIQFASPDAAAKAGVEVEPVWEAPVVESVAANGEIIYDQTRVARLSARVPGTVWRVTRQVGDRVRQGDVLALVDAADVGRIKADFLQALAQLDWRSQVLANLRDARDVVSARQIQEAEAARNEAQIRSLTTQQALANLGLPVQTEELKGLRTEEIAARVRFLGLPTEVAKALDPATATANLLPLKAPLDGVVVERGVVAGEVVDSAKVLFVVADASRMWLTLNVRQEDAKKLALGQPVHFRVGGSAEEIQGSLSWISTAVDEKTRTVQVRADLANPDGALRANTFGAGRVILREEPSTVVVANDALQWDGDCHVVFVRDRDYDPRKTDSLLVFHTRKVRPGARTERYTEMIAGVLPGEIVATRGSGVLRSELLKNNLGAG